LAIFIYSVRRNLAGYLGMSEKVDAIVFTGRIGANRDIQRLVVERLPAARGIIRLTVPADEEQAMIDALPK
jgi:acetate kinase